MLRQLVGRKIKALRESEGLTQTELAEKSGVHRTTINRAEAGKGLGEKNLRKLLKALGVSLEEALGIVPGEPIVGTRALSAASEDRLDAAYGLLRSPTLGGEPIIMVPLVEGEIAAGVPVITEDHIIALYPVLGSHIYRRKDLVCIQVAGDSMEPVIPDGTIVAIDRAPVDISTLNRKVVAVRHGDGVAVKRLVRSGDHWLLKSYNPDYEPEVLDPKEERPIIGEVVYWSVIRG